MGIGWIRIKFDYKKGCFLIFGYVICCINGSDVYISEIFNFKVFVGIIIMVYFILIVIMIMRVFIDVLDDYFINKWKIKFC